MSRWDELEVFELDSNIKNRIKDDKTKKEKIRSGNNEAWRVSGGGYQNSFFSDQEPNYNQKTEKFDLKGEEVVLYDLIHQKLSERETSSDKSPLVVVDIGGMYSQTWCRLALHFKEKIDQDKIRFIVTNLNLDKDNVDKAFRSEMAADPYDDRMQESFRTGKDLVEWHKMDVPQLWEKFRGRIDIAHEDMALTHSSIPDIDFPMVAQCLKKDGIFISESIGPHPGGSDYRNVNLDEIKEAYNMAKRGLDTKYHRLLKGGARADIWSPDQNANKYFRDSKYYPDLIKYSPLEQKASM